MNDRSSAPRVLLIGMMGAGKTTVGQALAALTGWPYLDNDDLVQRATGRSTPEVLATSGETTLRRLERAVLDEALHAEPPVIAGVAAGTIADPEARERMRVGAFVVYLHVPIDVLAERVARGERRPWVEDDPVGALVQLIAGREPQYRETADLVLDIDAGAPEQLARTILAAIGA